VAGYTITITPDDDTAPQTTIRVDTSTGPARIVELNVRAADGSGLAAGQLPAVNLDQMISALNPGQAPALSAGQPAEPATSGRQRRARAGRATAKATRAKATRQARAAKAAKAAEQPERTGRAYRRMPEADEVVAAYRDTGGSTTALAQQYGVPRHTATGWVRRLRRLGLLETPRRR
jgi:hypothetical protein